MEFLPPANRVAQGDLAEHPFDAEGKNVIIIGGGDTGADCLGTVHRQGAASVKQFEIMPRPPTERDPSTPWPTWPLMMRTSSAHEEGGERLYSIQTKEFLGEGGEVRSLLTTDVKMSFEDGRMSFEELPGSEEEHPAELVLLALGFTGPERGALLDSLNLDFDTRGNVARDGRWMTSVPGVFVCGDMGRGQSLIVWAIAEGRSCAAALDYWLEGRTMLPAPVIPTDQPLR